jgi:hypothetical protein
MLRSPLAIVACVGMWGLLLVPRSSLAHCDGLDGPVVGAAREALRTGNAKPVLIWVHKADEPEILRAFEHALAVRKLGAEAMTLADTYFFETVVRVHRAREGAPYTGLNPAGRDLGPAIPAADTALRTGDVSPLVQLLTEDVTSGAREHFKQAQALSSYAKDDVNAGRRFVEAYVSYIHYVERIYQAAKEPAEGHYAEEGAHRSGAEGDDPPGGVR